jgi:hypothetical protein
MGSAEAVFGTEAAASRRFVHRVLGAVRLEPGTWDEIARDASALAQAGLVAFGAALLGSAADAAGEGAYRDVLTGGLATLSLWPLVAVCLWGGAHGLGHPLGFATSLRLVGFAMAPLALIALAAVPVPHLQAVVRLLAWALFFAALVAGTRQALRIETPRAALVCALAGLALFFVALLAVATFSMSSG